MNKLILASSSPRRADLLRQMGIESFVVLPADIDETPLKGELAKDLVTRLALEKAQKIRTQDQTSFILAADTMVVLGRRVLGKPENEEQALGFLTLLSGRRHRVYTGFCIITPEGKTIVRHAETKIAFKRLSTDEKTWYLSTNEWQGKAGGYALQGKASRFISWINGCPHNVIGLPLHEVYKVLMGNGFFG
jgi:septum formation protein